MPSEPNWNHRIVRDDLYDEPSGKGAPRESAPFDAELPDEFPDDLAELASQLSADALFLSERYPAVQIEVAQRLVEVAPTVAQPASRQRWASVPSWAALAASLVLAVGLTLGSPSFVGNFRGRLAGNQGNQLASDAAPQLATDATSPGRPEVARRDTPKLSGAATESLLPEESFGELTGPEQEAVLDLFEARALEPSSLSI